VKDRCRSVGRGHRGESGRPHGGEHHIRATDERRVAQRRDQPILGRERLLHAHRPQDGRKITALDDQVDVGAGHRGLEKRVVNRERPEQAEPDRIEQPHRPGFDESPDAHDKSGRQRKPKSKAQRNRSHHEVRQWRYEGEQYASWKAAG